MPKFRVKPGQTVTHGTGPKDVRSYKAGEVITLTTEEAAAMPWAVEPMEPGEPEAPKK